MSLPGQSSGDYVSLSLVIICSVFFTVIYWWRREYPAAAISVAFWYVTGIMWLFSTSTPVTGYMFWGIGTIMLVYVIVDAVRMLSGRSLEREERDYEESGISEEDYGLGGGI